MERGNLTKYEKHVYKQIFKSLEYISSLLALQFGSVSVCICVQKMLTPLLLPFEMPQNHYAHQYHAVDTGQSRSCRAPLPPASLTPIVMERCGPALGVLTFRAGEANVLPAQLPSRASLCVAAELQEQATSLLGLLCSFLPVVLPKKRPGQAKIW